MKHKKTKLLSILLALVMMVGLLPMGQVAYAEDPTYTITVNGGKAYDASGHPIEGEMREGGYCFVVPTAVEGKYVTSWTASPNIEFIENGKIASFNMPANNVTLTPNYAEQTPYTVDLSGGGSVSIDADVFRALMDIYEPNVYPKENREYPITLAKFEDISIKLADDGSATMKKPSTCTLTGTYSVTQPNTSPYSPINIKFDNSGSAEYGIAVTGGKAYDSGDKVITSAEPGDMIYIAPDVLPGKYVKDWTANPSMTFEFNTSVAYFEMPANNVTLTPNYAEQTPHTVDLSGGDWVDVDPNAYNALRDIYSISTPRDRVDLDGNGAKDVDVAVMFSTDPMDPPSYSLKKLDTTNLTGTYSVTQPNTSPYSPINIKFDNSGSTTMHNIKVKGGKAYSDKDRTMEVTKAKAGDKIYLEYNEPPADKYVTKITCNAGEFDEDDYKDGYTMPDKDVTFTVHTANRRTVTSDLRTGPCKTGSEDFNLPPYGSGIHILVPKVDIPHDLDGDGNYDILLRYSQTPWVIEKHPDTNLKGRYTINIEELNTSISKYVYIFSGSSGGGGSSSGGGGGVSSYAVEVAKSENGSVTASPTSAKAGAKVTLTAKPAEGYETDKITVTDKSGKEVAVTKNSDGTYSFTMPASKVSVKPAFKEATDIVPEEETPLLVVTINSMKYQLNVKTMTMDSAPFIDGNNRTMLPVRVIANALGISNDNIKWDSATKTASFTRADGKVVSCTVNSNVIKVGDEKVTIDTVPVIRNNRIYLPMRALFNAFDVPDENIIWDATARTVTVTKKD